MKILSKIRWGILFGLSLPLCIGAYIGGDYAFNYGASAISMALGTSDYKEVVDDEAEPETIYVSDYDFMQGDVKEDPETADLLFEEDSRACEEAELEGAVLLWNNNDALPLDASENRISLLSHSSVDLVECGSGSGYIQTVTLKNSRDVSVSMKTAFESRDFQVNPTLWNFYSTGAGSTYKRTSPEGACTEWRQWSINEVPWSVYTDSVKSSFASYDDVAFIIISRTGGEYSDLHYNYSGSGDYTGNNDKGTMENTSAEGGVLGLTQQEKDLFSHVCQYRQNNTFKKLVLLLNTPNPIMFKHLSPYVEDIDACMWIGQTGSSGIYSVVDLLRGELLDGTPISPSGRLADTFMYNLNSAPASVNDGNNRYGNHNLLNSGGRTEDNNLYNSYQVYAENIYVGYRYYETRYEDCVLGTGNADSSKGAMESTKWEYESEVAFPFGYGDSYTQFSYSNYSISFDANSNKYIASAKVKNTGDYPGKEVVQVYLQKPYTDFDIDNEIEKSAIELVGYKKTDTLQPGKEETVTIEIPKEYFKTYDAEVYQTYIIEAGDYYLTFASDSHNAINNVLKAKVGSATDTSYYLFGDYEKNNPIITSNDSVARFTLTQDAQTYSYSTQTGQEITNQFDEADINKYSNRGNNEFTYLSRSDWGATYPNKPTDSNPHIVLNAEMVVDLRRDNVPDDSGYETPTYGKSNGLSVTDFFDAPLYPELASDEDKAITYSDGLSYVDHWNKMWNDLMDQTTWEEQSLFCSDAYHRMQGCTSISLPESKQENGPVGITRRGDFPVPNNDEIGNYYFVCYPCAGIMASSFNEEVGFDVGKHKSEDMLFTGYNGIYGPGVNMHRTPYNGRAFEYPSEDPLLAGLTSYHESRGINTKGCMAFAKHFAMNDQETNRRHVGVWSKEQATREIYLRAYELCFAEGGATATMNGFNRIGTKWCGGCKTLMTDVLRKEWGWTGVNITDWMSSGPMSYIDALIAGTNSFDGNGSSTKFDAWRNNKYLQTQLRESTRVIVYNVLHSNAVNSRTASIKVYKVTPWWRAAIYSIQGFFLVTSIYTGVMLALSIVLPIVGKKTDTAWLIEENKKNKKEGK